MSKISRDVWLTLLILLVLALLTIIAASQTSIGENLPPLSSFSSAPSGSKALRLWLEGLGFNVSNQPPVEFLISPDTKAIIMLQPFSYLLLSDKEWEIIDGWVNEGGKLFIVGDGLGISIVFEHFGFSALPLIENQESLFAYSPHLSSPPQTQAATAYVKAYFQSDRDDYLTLVAVEEGPVTVAFDQGEGWVVLSTAIYPFSNQGLKEPGNPELVLNTLALIDEWSTIWIDEWHHGQIGNNTELSGPIDWLKYTPTGRALLFVVGVLFLGLVLSGRMFGKPVPIPKEISRRPELEYVSSMANLKRRIAHRQEVLESYHRALKRELSRRYRIDPELEDREYVEELSQYNPTIDAAALLDLLDRLRQDKVSEQTMIRLASEVAQWINPEEHL
jgi:hypothetical protein